MMDFKNMMADIDPDIGKYLDTNEPTTTLSKLDTLQSNKQKKLDKLSNVKTAELYGMPDSDTFNTSIGTIRESDRDGLRYDATELDHEPTGNWYDSFGNAFAHAKDALGFDGPNKSEYAMSQQKMQAARMLGYDSVDQVTEQDLIDVGNWQQIQKLADEFRSDGQERWVAPFIRNAEQVDLTDLRDTEGRGLQIGVDPHGGKDANGRILGSIHNLQTGDDVTSMHARDANLNAFALPDYYDEEGNPIKQPEKSKAGVTNAIKGFTHMLGEGVFNTLDLPAEVLEYGYKNIIGDGQDWKDTEGIYDEEKKKAFKEWTGYSDAALSTLGANAKADLEEAMKTGDYWKLAGTLWEAVTTLELVGVSGGFVMGLVLPGTAATKVVQATKGVNKLAGMLQKSDKTLDKAAAIAKAEAQLAKDGKIGAGYKIAKILGGNVGFVAEAEQFGRRADEEYAELYGEDPSPERSMANRAVGLLWAKLDATIAKAIVLGKDPVAKTIPDLIKKLPDRMKVSMAGKIAVMSGASATRVASTFGMEGSTEAIQKVMEVLAGRYKDGNAGEVLSEAKTDIALDALLGGAGGLQMGAPSMALDTGKAGFSKGLDKYSKYQNTKEVESARKTLSDTDKINLDKDLENITTKTEAVSASLEANDINAAVSNFKELHALATAYASTDKMTVEEATKLAESVEEMKSAIKAKVQGQDTTAMEQAIKEKVANGRLLGATKEDVEAVKREVSTILEITPEDKLDEVSARLEETLSEEGMDTSFIGREKEFRGMANRLRNAGESELADALEAYGVLDGSNSTVAKKELTSKITRLSSDKVNEFQAIAKAKMVADKKIAAIAKELQTESKSSAEGGITFKEAKNRALAKIIANGDIDSKFEEVYTDKDGKEHTVMYDVENQEESDKLFRELRSYNNILQGAKLHVGQALTTQDKSANKLASKSIASEVITIANTLKQDNITDEEAVELLTKKEELVKAKENLDAKQKDDYKKKAAEKSKNAADKFADATNKKIAESRKNISKLRKKLEKTENKASISEINSEITAAEENIELLKNTVGGYSKELRANKRIEDKLKESIDNIDTVGNKEEISVDELVEASDLTSDEKAKIKSSLDMVASARNKMFLDNKETVEQDLLGLTEDEFIAKYDVDKATYADIEALADTYITDTKETNDMVDRYLQKDETAADKYTAKDKKLGAAASRLVNSRYENTEKGINKLVKDLHNTLNTTAKINVAKKRGDTKAEDALFVKMPKQAGTEVASIAENNAKQLEELSSLKDSRTELLQEKQEVRKDKSAVKAINKKIKAINKKIDAVYEELGKGYGFTTDNLLNTDPEYMLDNDVMAAISYKKNNPSKFETAGTAKVIERDVTVGYLFNSRKAGLGASIDLESDDNKALNEFASKIANMLMNVSVSTKTSTKKVSVKDPKTGKYKRKPVTSTVKLKEVKVTDYTLTQDPGFFVTFNTDKNGKYVVNKNIALTMKAVLDDFVMSRASRLIKNDVDTIRKMVGKSEGETLTTAELRAFNEGALLNYIAEDLGNALMKELGMKPRENVLSEGQLAVMKQNLGMRVIGLGVAEGTLAIKGLSTEDRAAVFGESSTNKEANLNLLVVKGKDQKAKKSLVDGRAQAAKRSRLAELLLRDSKKKAQRYIAKEERDVSIAGTYNTLLASDVMNSSVNIEEGLEYTIERQVFNDLVNLEKEDQTKFNRLLGVVSEGKLEELAAEDRIKAESKNDEATRYWNSLKEYVAELDTDGTAADTIMFDRKVAKNLRSMVESNGLNPQTSKLHRFAIMLKSSTYTVDPKKNDGSTFGFGLALAQAMGFKVDKKKPEESYEFAKKLFELSENDIATIKKEVLSSPKGEYSINGIHVEIEELTHFLHGVNELAKFNLAKQKGSTFDTRLQIEVDGITNGVALKQLQSPLGVTITDNGMEYDKTVEELARVGIRLVGNPKDKKSHLNEEKVLDGYENLVNGLIIPEHHRIASDIDMTTGDVKYVGGNGKIPKLLNDEAYNLLKTLLPSFETIEGVISSAQRNIGKPAHMTAGYNAQPASIRKNIGDAVATAEGTATKLLEEAKALEAYYTEKDKLGVGVDIALGQDSVSKEVYATQEKLKSSEPNITKLVQLLIEEGRGDKLSNKRSAARLIKALKEKPLGDLKLADIGLQNNAVLKTRGADRFNLKAAKTLGDYLREFGADVYGDQVVGRVVNTFKDTYETNRISTNALKTMFYLYEHKKDVLEAEYKAAIAKSKGVRADQIELTIAEKKEIKEKLLYMFPTFKTGNQGTVEIVNTRGDRKESNRAQTTLSITSGKTKTITTNALVKTIEAARSSGAVLGTQASDGEVMAKAVIDLFNQGIEVQDIFDAILVSGVHGEEASAALNKAFAEVSLEFNADKELLVSLSNTLAGMTEEEINKVDAKMEKDFPANTGVLAVNKIKSPYGKQDKQQYVPIREQFKELVELGKTNMKKRAGIFKYKDKNGTRKYVTVDNFPFNDNSVFVVTDKVLNNYEEFADPETYRDKYFNVEFDDIVGTRLPSTGFTDQRDMNTSELANTKLKGIATMMRDIMVDTKSKELLDGRFINNMIAQVQKYYTGDINRDKMKMSTGEYIQMEMTTEELEAFNKVMDAVELELDGFRQANTKEDLDKILGNNINNNIVLPQSTTNVINRCGI
jgi:hypothetical protein